MTLRPCSRVRVRARVRVSDWGSILFFKSNPLSISGFDTIVRFVGSISSRIRTHEHDKLVLLIPSLDELAIAVC